MGVLLVVGAAVSSVAGGYGPLVVAGVRVWYSARWDRLPVHAPCSTQGPGMMAVALWSPPPPSGLTPVREGAVR